MREFLHKLRGWACSYLGYILFVAPAVVMHVFWSLYGAPLAWALAKLGCDAKTIRESYMLLVGPMYVSSKLGRNWVYGGCEPEGIRDRNGIPTLVIDRSFAARWSQAPTENLKGNETKRGHAAVEFKTERSS